MPYIGNQPYQGVIDSGNIVDGSIQTGDLANSAVTAAKIADTGVTVAKLNSDVTQLIAQGGGPKITGVTITNSSWTTIDDTALDTAGGYIKLTGTNFVTGCSVVVGTMSATAVTFTSSTELRVQLPAQAAGTYILYVTNPDGGTAIRVNAVTYSATPSWVTSSTLPQQDDGVAISIQLSATSATTYALQAGSTLPSGLTLTSGGLLSGTVSGLASDTSYSFTVVATDAELQDSPRAFTVTISAVDSYFNLTTLLINGDTAPNVLTDASSNNFNLIAYGDARASNFTPYGAGWSNYFDGSGDYLYAGSNVAFQMSTGDFTYECYVYHTNLSGQQTYFARTSGNNNGMYFYKDTSNYVGVYYTGQIATSNITITTNQWYHLVATRLSGILKIFINGAEVASVANTTNLTEQVCYIGADSNGTNPFFGYISNARILKGTGYSSITIPTQPLTAITNTSLLTCHANRIVDGSANNFAITRNGDVAVRSFNPFNITNTSVDGSMYFDGTGDYLSAPSNAAFNVSTNNVTAEAWVYLTAFNTAGSPFISTIWSLDSSGSNNTFAYIYNTGSIAVGINGVNEIASSAGVIKLGAWYHTAVVRNGSTTTIYVNGVSVATNTTSVWANTGARPFLVGSTSQSASYYLTGYISNMRFVNGTAIYTSEFTPPTAPVTNITNTQLLILQNKQPHNNHSFQDSSTNNYLITRNGNATQGTFSPFSAAGWSGYFNGSTDGMVIASGSDSYDFNSWMLESTASRIGSIEAWIYLQSHSTPTVGTGAYSHRSITGRGSTFFNFGVRPDGKLRAYYYNSTGSTQNWYESAANAIQLNTWYHVAFVADAGIAKLYINGVYSSGNRITNGTDSGTTAFNGVAVGTFSEGGIHYIGRENGEPGTSRWHGYIANLRIVSGQSLYTTNFTPSISPLTTTSQGVSGTNCKLLTLHTNRFKDDGPNNRTFTLEGTPSIQAYSPFKPTAAYSPTTHGGSAYFDGSGDKLSIPDNDAAFNFGSGDFTVEAWVYPFSTGITSGTSFYNQSLGGAASDSAIYIACTTDGVTVYVSTGTGWQYNASNSSLALGSQWNHVAAVRSGTTLSIYANGTRQATTTLPANWTMGNSTRIVEIGSQANQDYFRGYISGLRVVRNQALYSGTTYTIPTAPFTAITDTQLLLNFTDAAARDSSGRLVLETVNDSKVSVVQKKYGTGAMYFDGTGDYVYTTRMTPLGSGDFTIELWCYTTVIGANTCIFDLSDSGTSGFMFRQNTNNSILVYNRNASTNILVTSNNSIATNVWQHIAVVRSAGTVTVYVNGVNVGSGANSVNYTQTSMYLGAFIGEANSPYAYTGYIDDLRVTRYARYTGSSTSTPNFTPPAQTFKLR